MVGKTPKSGRGTTRGKRSRRNPSRKTRTIVGAKSSNRCAFPECPEPIVKNRASGELYLAGVLCHIHGNKPGSARHDPNLSPAEVNAPSNLLFLCRNHHEEVDEDEDRYTPSRLREMKAHHERHDSAAAREHLTALLTIAVENDLRFLRRARFFEGFDSTKYCRRFSGRLRGTHSYAASPVRAGALAWCARLLAADDLERATDSLRLAESLVPRTPEPIEVTVARAFTDARRSDVSGVLKALDSLASPAATTAAFAILRRHENSAAALSWLHDSGHTPGSLDSDGRLMLVMTLLNEGHWDDLESAIPDISDTDYEECPALHYAVGLALVAAETPPDMRPEVVTAIPLNALNFPLASTRKAMASLRLARDHFDAAAEAAEEFDLPSTATLARDYSLWLRLRDPAAAESAKRDLAPAVATLPENLRLIPMAMQCGVPFDIEKTERAVDLHEGSPEPKIAADAAFARLALAFTKPPKDAAQYLEKHEEALSRHIDRTQITMRRAELLMLAQESESARGLLKEIPMADLSQLERDRLRSLFVYSREVDIAALKKHYEQTGETKDLGRVVMAMQRQEDWEAITDYGRRLFERTGSVEDAERLATALITVGKNEELDTFLDEIGYLVEASEALRGIRCWHLFDIGEVLECEAQLKDLGGGRADPNLDSMRFNLAVASGDWLAIPKLVADGYADRKKKGVEDLVQLAQRSLYFDLPYTRELVHEVAERGERDAHALAAAYWLGTAAKMEDDPRLGGWLRESIARSDGKGPMTQVSLSEFARRAAEWNERVATVSDHLRKGDIPTCLAGEALRVPLVDFFLRAAIENRKLEDGARRGVVVAYSGVRGRTDIADTRRVALGPTALMTLSLLDELRGALDQIEEVVIPHGTMAWLFRERERLRFHQPSQVAAAERVVQLAGDGVLEVVGRCATEGSGGDEALGEDLASLLFAVDGGRRECSAVIVSNPVERLVGDTVRPVDLSRYYGTLLSPHGVVRALAAFGGITQDECDDAWRTLSGEGTEWPREPIPERGADLYLDGLTLGRFLNLRIRSVDVLRRLRRAGFRLRVSEHSMEWHRGLLRHRDTSREIGNQVEAIRSALRSGIQSGKVRLGPLWRRGSQEERDAYRHPEVDLVRLARRCGAVMTDDRCLNRMKNIEDDGREIPVWTTWDWLRGGAGDGARQRAPRADFPTRLREAGYLFVPVNSAELLGELRGTRIVGDRLEETAVLRGIRSEFALVRESGCLRWPDESPWLLSVVEACAEAVEGVWRLGSEPEDAMARADWVNDLLNADGWRLLAPAGAAEGDTRSLTRAYTKSLRGAALRLPGDRGRDFSEWIESRVSAPRAERRKRTA